MSKVKYSIKKNTYYDSVKLMLISKDVKNMEGVHEALVGMGTDLNKELAENLNIINDAIKNIGPNDFFITVLADENVDIETIVEEADRLLNQKSSEGDADYMPPTLASALEHSPDSNIAIISVAGEYAADEARKALNNGLHVMIFSDNVKVEDEKSLKIFKGKFENNPHDKNPGSLEIDKHQFNIFTIDGFYSPEEVQLEGKKRMSVKDFLNGFQKYDHITMA